MADTIHILGFSGSLRKKSFNSQLLRVAAGMLPEGMTLEIYDLNPLPMYNGDLEQNGFPDVVEDFRNKIKMADALLLASPEYNASLTGALKNAIDWASRSTKESPSPLNAKPAAVMGVGGRSGTARGQAHLRQVATHVNLYLMNKPEVTISQFPQSAFDAEGNLADPMATKFLGEMLVALRDWTLLFKK